MSPDNKPLTDEASRHEESSIYSGKGHFEAAKRWGHVHLWLGIPATVLAALSGASAIKDMPEMAVAFALASTVMTALLTFLNPQQRANAHKLAGDRFFAICDEIRILREIEIQGGLSWADATARLKLISKARAELNQSSPQIPRYAYEAAKRGIEADEHRHSVDMLSDSRQSTK